MKPAKSMLMALALGKPKAGAKGGASESEDDDAPEDMGGGAKMTAARDLLAAVKAGDADAVSRAMSDHYDACAAGESEEGTEEEEA